HPATELQPDAGRRADRDEWRHRSRRLESGRMMFTPDGPRIRNLAEIVQGVQSGALSAERVVRECRELTEERDGEVRAWEVLNDVVAAQAKALDAGRGVKGLLAGAPIGVKDVIDTRELPTAYGAALYRG